MANTKVKAEQLEAAQTNITSLGTLTALTVDDITIDGSTISDGGDLTIDVAGDIILDADGGDIILKDDGTTFGQFSNSSGDLFIQQPTANKDIVLRGYDGSSYISAITFDMSAGGNATFAGEVTFNDDIGLGMNGASFGTGVPTINFKGTSNSNTRAGALLFKENNDDNVAALYVTDGSDTYGTVLAAYQGDIKFSTATLAGYKMTIKAGGNVGIGETSPGALLHVKHSGGGFDEVARLTSVANSAGDGAFLGFHGNSTSKFYGFIGGYDIAYNKGGIKIGVGNGETAIHDDMTALTIDNDGGVTMTRADNGAVLTLKSTDSDADRGPVMDFFRDASDGVNANNDKIGAIRFLGNDTVGQSDVYFIMEAIINQADNGAEDGYLDISGLHNGAKTRCMIIGGSGGSKVYVGPAVADMGGYLNVANAGCAIGFADDQGYYRRIYAHTNSSSMELRFWNGVNEARLTTAGVWTNASDVNLKKDIVDIEYGLETVKKLKPRKYKMKANDEEQIGFIAQEVETEVPEVVGAGENPDGVIQKNLSYGQLTAVLTKAIQEQQELIETLQTKVAALENK